MRRISSVLFLLIASCTHEVHSLFVTDENLEKIEAALIRECPDEACSLLNCWWENDRLLFCDVEFSFMFPAQQTSILQRTSGLLRRSSLDVGFCGRDSVGTQMSVALGFGLICGMVGGSGPCVSSTSLQNFVVVIPESQSVVIDPCASSPVQSASLQKDAFDTAEVTSRSNFVKRQQTVSSHAARF